VMMTRMHTTIPFAESDWSRIERDWTAWWQHDLGRPLLLATPTAPTARPRPRWWGDQLGGVPLDVAPEVIAEESFDELSRTTFLGDAWPKYWMNFGPGVVSAFLGGRLEATPGGTTWFHPGIWTGKNATEIMPSFDPENVWWRRVQAVTAACLARYAGQAQVAFTDLGGNLDIAAALRDTQPLLLECLDDPEAVGALCQRITPLWLRYYAEQCALIQPAGRGTSPWGELWSRERCYMLQSDFAYMISPKQFARWVVPDLVACCDQMEHGFYHLDGKGQLPHLDHLLAIPRLRGIQWIPGDGNPSAGEPIWWPVLKRIRDAGKLVQLYLTPDVALRLAREVPLDGFAIKINPSTPDEVLSEALLQEIWRVNAPLTRQPMVTVA
jgi:hypothetical protein